MYSSCLTELVTTGKYVLKVTHIRLLPGNCEIKSCLFSHPGRNKTFNLKIETNFQLLVYVRNVGCCEVGFSQSRTHVYVIIAEETRWISLKNGSFTSFLAMC